MKTTSARMELGYYDDTPADLDGECEIRIDGETIVVSYETDYGVIVYAGKDLGGGHYALECAEVHGKASLHHIPKSKFYEGFWVEQGERGFWRITLP